MKVDKKWWNGQLRYHDEFAQKPFDKMRQNYQRALREIIAYEAEAKIKRKSQPRYKLSAEKYRRLLYHVYYIERNSDRVHYVIRFQMLTGVPYEKIMIQANNYARLRREIYEKKRREVKDHAKNH